MSPFSAPLSIPARRESGRLALSPCSRHSFGSKRSSEARTSAKSGRNCIPGPDSIHCGRLNHERRPESRCTFELALRARHGHGAYAANPPGYRKGQGASRGRRQGFAAFAFGGRWPTEDASSHRGIGIIPDWENLSLIGKTYPRRENGRGPQQTARHLAPGRSGRRRKLSEPMTYYQDDEDGNRNSFSLNGHLPLDGHGGDGRSPDTGPTADDGMGPPPENSDASYPLRKLQAGEAELEEPDEEQGLEGSVGDVVPGYLYRMEVVENGRLQKQIREVQEKNERLKRDYERLKSRVDRAPEPADYEPFPVSRLPTTAQKVVRAISAAQDVENAFVAVPLLSVLGSAVGASARVRLKAGWKEPAMIWTALVAYSGAGKTPVFRSLVSAVQEKEMEAKKKYDRYIREDYDPDSDEPKPARTRYLVNDVNPEKVTRILGENTRGVLLHRDELAAWLGGMNKYSDGQDELQFWIKGWDGDFFSYDRVSAGTITVSTPSVSVAGGIQPGILKKHISEVHIESGFLARCILCQPPTSPSGWTEAEFTRAVRGRYSELITALYNLKEKMKDGDPFEVELSPEAKAVWVPFYEEADRRRYREPEGPIKALLGKHIAYAARFALIFHLCRVAGGEREHGPLGAETMHDAIEVAKWCLEETIRVYRSLDLGTAAKSPMERFLARLPRSFTTSEAREAFPAEKDERTMYRWLNDLCDAGKVVKEVKGKYRKTAG